MARVELQITRRTFLKSALAGGGGLALAACGLEPAQAAAGVDLSPTWFREGKIKTSYTCCSMCPWSCGIVVQSVDGVVHKVDGNPADPK
ncbi:MAG: twin-arginine translocation signal domain-containing protein, partial [Caldilineaceae bacterium]|nr:twin-arginine translocation signal domain-containing protein [Caldilineaceae bacterium]